jgi:hypothetical protein
MQDSTIVAGELPGRGYRLFHYAMIVVVLAALAATLTATGWGLWSRLGPDDRVASVRLISDGSSVSGASSKLTREDDRVVFEFKTAGLPMGHIVTLRAEIFNYPEHCTHGDQRHHCGTDDLQDPAVGGSVMFLFSTVLRQRTDAQFSGTVLEDDSSRAILGDGLHNPQGADIDFVLMDHGTLIEGVPRLLSTIGDGCTAPVLGVGSPGPSDCADIQYSMHQ